MINNSNNIFEYNGNMPEINKDVFIAPGAKIIGNVSVGANSSIWFNCIIRGDVSSIEIGEGVNIQDGTIIHVSSNDNGDTIIGNNVTIGHGAIIHACQLNKNAFVGMGAIIMDNSLIYSDAMIAAGSLVTPGKHIKSGTLWAGSPARYLRNLSDEEIERNRKVAKKYINISKKHAI